MQNKKRSALASISILAVLIFGTWMMLSLLQSSKETFTYSDIIYMFEDNLVNEYSLDMGTGKLIMKVNKSHPKFDEYAKIKEKENAKENEKLNFFKTEKDQYKVGVDLREKENDNYAVITYNLANFNAFREDTKDSIEKYNVEKIDAKKMQYEYTPAKDRSWLLTMLPLLITVALVGFLFFVMMKQTGGGGKISQFSKANAKTTPSGKKTNFSDVAGADEEKEELKEIVEFLKKPDRFNKLGARIPKGVLLVGPPGTGKTLLARAVAGEADVPFYSISGSDFVEMFVGVGASRVRDLFGTAKKNSPSIVFIDEIDAVGRQRGAGLGGGHDEREQTLNQLLVEMDGFGENSGVIIIAATNRRDILDPALLRPGRFDRQVFVGYPDVKGREEILKVHAKNKPLGFDVSLKKIARATSGFTGADLENLLNEAALLAARKNRKAITAEDIEASTIKVLAGPEKKSHKISDYDKKITAYHEAGHAVASYHCKTQDSVHEVSIIPRGMAAGYTMNIPDEDRLHVSKTKMQESLVVLLAGRVAEEISLDDICTGASNDIERATKTARDMITKYGFSTSLGPVVYGQGESEVFLGRDINHQKNYSENVAKEIDAEIRALIDNAYETARDILTNNRDQLELITKWLLEYEKINSETFKQLMSGELEFSPRKDDDEKESIKVDDVGKDADESLNVVAPEDENLKPPTAE